MNRSDLVFSIIGRKYGFNMRELVRFVEDNQHWDSSEIEDYQLKKLQSIVTHAYDSVPFYRKFMKRQGITPNDVLTLDDLGLFPVINKRIIMENIMDFKADDFDRRKPMARSTGGTTGIPFKYYNDTSSWGLNWATKIRAFTWGGYRLGTDRIAILKGGSMYNMGHIGVKSKAWRWLQNNYSFNIMSMTDTFMSKYYTDLRKSKIEFMRGYPSAISIFAEWINKNNLTLKMKRVFTTAEMLLPHQRSLIENTFGCNIIDTYGCGDGMGGASQCQLSQKYHINHETSVMEVLDSSLIHTSKPGEIGEIVLTSLHDYSMPFIRYSPGDQAVVSAKGCACGTKMKTLDKIIGRTSDVFNLPNGRIINGLSIPLESWTDKIHRFQIIHERDTLIVIKLIIKEAFKLEDEKAILDLFHFIAGEGIDINVMIVDDIPLTKSGKHKYVISLVNSVE